MAPSSGSPAAVDESALQPTQEAMQKVSLRPGVQVDLAVRRDWVRETIDVRQTRLQDFTAEGHLILAQTDPPIGQDMQGQEVEPTFLVKVPVGEKVRLMRTGYKTPVVAVDDAYDLGTVNPEPVVIVEAPTELAEANLRMHFRMQCPSGVELQIMPADLMPLIDKELAGFAASAREELAKGEKKSRQLISSWTGRLEELLTRVAEAKKPLAAPALDLSQGGVRFAHPEEFAFPKGTEAPVILAWGRHRAELMARVIRGGKHSARSTMASHFTCLQFINVSPETKAVVKLILADMVRLELAKRSGMA